MDRVADNSEKYAEFTKRHQAMTRAVALRQWAKDNPGLVALIVGAPMFVVLGAPGCRDYNGGGQLNFDPWSGHVDEAWVPQTEL